MAQEELEIEIDAQGRVQVRTIGIKGARCLDYAEALARILGREESRELDERILRSGADHADACRRETAAMNP